MPLGAIPTLDSVIQASGNETTEYIDFIRAVNEYYLRFITGAKILGIRYRETPNRFIFESAESLYFDVQAGDVINFSQAGGQLGAFGSSGLSVIGLRPLAATPDIGLTGAGFRFRDLFLSRNFNIAGDISIDGGTKNSQIVDIGTALKILHGAGPDQGIGLGCCSGGSYYIDIDDTGTGRTDMQAERYSLNDGGVDPAQNFMEIMGWQKTSGHVVVISGDVAKLTTGDLFRIYNDGGGAGTNYLFGIDKNGVISIGDSTGAEHGKIERTLTELIIDCGASANLNFKVNGTPYLSTAGGWLQLHRNSRPGTTSALDFGDATHIWQKIFQEEGRFYDVTGAEYAKLTRSLTQTILDTMAATLEIQIDSIKALTIDATNSLEMFKTDGTPRYWHEYNISAYETSAGASGATLVDPNANTLGGYQLDADTENLSFQTHVEDDWDGASDPIVEVVFEVNINNGGGLVTDTVDLKLIFYYKGDGETANKTQTVEVATVVGQSPQFKQFKATFTLDWDFGGNVVEALDTLAAILNLETDTSEVDNVIINYIEFKYKTTKPRLEVA